MNNDDILDSVGGSLLNDLLSDLNAAVAANHTKSGCHDGSDDLFARLEQELTSTYADLPAPPPPAAPLSMQQQTPAAFVVQQQTHYPPPPAPDTSDDAWSTALSGFGSMSLAADFLAADSATKQKQEESMIPTLSAISGDTKVNLHDKLFEDDEDYVLEEEVVFDTPKEVVAEKLNSSLSLKLPVTQPDTKVAGTETGEVIDTTLPSLPYPHPNNMVQQTNNMAQQPNNMAQYSMPMPPPAGPGMMPPHPMMFNPAYMPPPQPDLGMGSPSPQVMGQQNHEVAKQRFGTEEFPALGSKFHQGDKNQELKEVETPKDESTISRTTAPIDTQPIFNNAYPGAAPVDARRLSAKLMPSKDICFIIKLMLRPLQSLDLYNDDYYHWSFVNRGSPFLSRGSDNNPTPVRKGVKVTAMEQEEKFNASMKARASDYAQEQKSLGQLVKTNVKRPKALLNTSVLKKDSAGESLADESLTGTKYESEQQSNRISVWKARVSIDRGYAAFLSLVELRRLIQAHAGATKLINELMADVKTNVDLLHSALGVTILVDPKGTKKVEIEKLTLASTLSMPKGRVLCARVIEEGILPHLSACNILPAALFCIFSSSHPATDGEDRLLHALTGLILIPQPSIDPQILCSCLDMVILAAGNKDELSLTTSSHLRMKLLHAILSTGKHVSAGSPVDQVWSQKEKKFMDSLKV